VADIGTPGFVHLAVVRLHGDFERSFKRAHNIRRKSCR
jgi:hypothetical protein